MIYSEDDVKRAVSMSRKYAESLLVLNNGLDYSDFWRSHRMDDEKFYQEVVRFSSHQPVSNEPEGPKRS